ncbi:1-(5-phosphoribosyl)-5-[(5-phosphoribosylamino)methylideneamino] imidazole-4-carboxamide isomerase [Planctomycetes bacterium Pan216]|uniref:1-(5-phosphoribosyl)-5-[(5-phosphoribosylamino)methylideneamino] imidazole-4-carboxamide isomerase n=1 Tax=Kolteria novifilia TaxID=2527975 RepID=A0A518AWX9_9BACT|nr:1-(5-phosphoribosyl)-5-[(5-phosphoribosylamino)methylideneamino] imidazole-4-carboxamide isomerase [Planctomycetes bacterium Pan216]
MQVIPAIDLRGGSCVRLRQGDYGQETVFDADPVAVARRWKEEGADFLHLVDLDGAKEGRPVNTDVIRAIVSDVEIPCQLGGGLRDDDAIKAAFDLGVSRAIIGTRAVRDPEWFTSACERFPGKLVLGLDARDGMVATDGWLQASETTAVELAKHYAEAPLAAIVYTDIARDGMMSGPNVDATCRLAESSPHQVIASGGVTTIEDVLELQRRGIGACILGRTLYEGKVKLPELLNQLGAV